MSAAICPREDELLDALERGFVGEELTAHAVSCAGCRELQLVASALLDDRASAFTEASLPASGTMLWRMQTRRRRDAQAAARRSLLVGQAVTLAVALALFAFLLGDELAAGVRGLVKTVRLSTPLLAALIVSLLLVPIAGYVAIRQK